MSNNNSAMREALIAAGVAPNRRRQRFNSFREFFANADVTEELKQSGMPDSKQMKLEDFQSSEQLVDFLNLTRHRLYRANSNNSLQQNYIQLLESNMVRAGVALPMNKPVNKESGNETDSNQPC